MSDTPEEPRYATRKADLKERARAARKAYYQKAKAAVKARKLEQKARGETTEADRRAEERKVKARALRKEAYQRAKAVKTERAKGQKARDADAEAAVQAQEAEAREAELAATLVKASALEAKPRLRLVVNNPEAL